VIVSPHEQGTTEWQRERLGLPTASGFGKLICADTRKAAPHKWRLSAQADAYLADKCAEWLLQEPIDVGRSGFMQRGTDLESRARAALSWELGVIVEPIGFCTTDDGRIGASPDGQLVGCNAGAEIKTLEASNHIAALLEADASPYFAQIQGGLYVTGWDYWVLYFYHPTLPSLPLRVDRDAEYQAALGDALGQFLERFEAAKAKLIERGCRPAAPIGERCRARLADQRWCMSRNGLVKVNGEWRCAKHVAELVEAV